LPELPLERTLSRKSVLCQVESCDPQGRITPHPDLSTGRSRTLLYQLSLDYEALLVVGHGAGLKRDERFAFFGLHNLDIVRVDDLPFGHAVLIGRPRLVLEQDLLSLDELVEVVEDEVRARPLVPETMADDVGVRPFCQGKPVAGMWTTDCLSFSSLTEL
jgi:hypothetical protein